MTYPVHGGEWTLDADACEELQRIYRRLDVALELEKARLWLLANPTRQKTARGMPRFVLGWLNRAAQLQAVRPSPLDAARPRTAPLWFASRECPHEPKCRTVTECNKKFEAEIDARRAVTG